MRCIFGVGYRICQYIIWSGKSLFHRNRFRRGILYLLSRQNQRNGCRELIDDFRVGRHPVPSHHPQHSKTHAKKTPDYLSSKPVSQSQISHLRRRLNEIGKSVKKRGGTPLSLCKRIQVKLVSLSNYASWVTVR